MSPVVITEILNFGDNITHYNNMLEMIRIVEIFINFFLASSTIIIGAFFVFRVKKYMYLYYQDFKIKLLLSIFGLVSYIVITMGHVSRNLYSITKNIELVDLEEYYIYFLLELLACAIFVVFHISDDLFVQLNRQRTLLKISIF